MTVLFLATITIGENFVLANAPKLEKRTLSVAAYSRFPVRLNGNVYWSMIIGVQDTDGQHQMTDFSKFVGVDFSLPCDQTPKWLKREQTPQTFRLIRLEQHVDPVLQESVKCSSDSGSGGVVRQISLILDHPMYIVVYDRPLEEMIP